jgi:hypothetical protein
MPPPRRILSVALAAVMVLALFPVMSPREAVFAEDASAPSILRQPADATYAENATARFYVSASSPDNGYLTYQWYVYKSNTGKMPDPNVNDYDDIIASSTKIENSESIGNSATSAVLTTLTPTSTETGTHWYYYWAEVTNNFIDEDNTKTTKDITTRIAEAKIVDRTLEDHITNGDFSTIVNVGLESSISSDNKGWGSFPNEMIPGWDTTHFQVNQADDKRAYAGKQYEIQSPNNAMPSPYGSSGSTVPDKTTAGHGVGGGNTAPYYVCELADQDYSSIYQEIATVPGKIYEWSLQHCAINNSQWDVMAVVIGAAIN